MTVPVVPTLPSPPTLTAIAANPPQHYRINGIKRGMIFWASVPWAHTLGPEQAHHLEQTSPWIVVSADAVHERLPIVQAVPCTSQLQNGSGYDYFRIRLKGIADYQRFQGPNVLKVEQLALTEQARVLAHERLMLPVAGQVTARALHFLSGGLRYVFDVPSVPR